MTDASVEIDEVLDRTSSALLVRVREKDQEAWRRFVQLYSPLVDHWCRRFGLQEADVADVGQEVFRTVVLSIDGFRHDLGTGSFRGWLRTIARSRCLDHLRRRNREPSANATGGSEAQARLVETPEALDDASKTDAEDRHILVRRAVELVLEHCKEDTRNAFLRVVIGGEDPGQVARDLGMTPNAVYLAKSHVLKKIREEFAQIVDP